MQIRQWEQRDLPAIRSCVICLQDHERAIDRRMPPGAAIADDYLARMLRRCKECRGTIFVADGNGEICGFVCVCASVPADGPDDGLRDYGLVSDLVVLPQYRNAGVGQSLLRQAEAYARQHGAGWLRVGVLSANAAARAFYAGAGYGPYMEYMEKGLEERASDPPSCT